MLAIERDVDLMQVPLANEYLYLNFHGVQSIVVSEVSIANEPESQ